MAKSVLLLVSLLGLLYGVAGQSCSTPFTTSPLTNFKCDVIITDPTTLFLAANQTYEMVDAIAHERTRVFGAFVPPLCRVAAIRLSCLSTFLKCDVSSGSLKLFPPCRSVCEEMVMQCSAVAAQLGVSSLLPDCNLISNATGRSVPAFPPDGTQCVAGPALDETVIAYSQADCPYPLIYDESGAVGEPLDMCKKKCRSTVWSDDVWIAGYTLIYVCTLVNFLTGTFLLVSWLLNPQTRRFPFNTITFFVLSLWPASFAILWGAFFNMADEDIMCTWDNPAVPVTMDNAGDNGGQGVACIVQGILVFYCVLSCIVWWFFVNVDCALQLFLRIRIEKLRWLQIVYHIIGWGVPLIGLALTLGFEKIGYENTFPVCQVYLDENVSWWDWAFFFGPMMFFTLLGMFLMFPGIITIIILAVRRLMGHKTRIELISYARLYFTLFIIWTFQIFVYSYRIDVEDRRDEVVAAYEEQVKCSLLTGEECEIEHTFNHGLWFLSLIALTNMITLIFVVLGSTKVTLKFWVRLFRRDGDEGPCKHLWSVIRGHDLDPDDRGFELRDFK